MLTFGSLFAGIGGLDLGLERAGMRCAWQVEIDPFARRVLAKHWPDVPRFEDVRQVGADLPAVDLICGGFPCQDISNAGRRAGIDGERSGLWAEYARVVGVVRPRYVLVENVSALLARGLDRVLGDLAALGYDAEWDCIPAAAVGAPHLRDRLFVVAARGDAAHAIGRILLLEPESEPRCRGKTITPDDGAANFVADADGEGELQQGGPVGEEWGWAGDGGEVVADANSAQREGDGRAQRVSPAGSPDRRGQPISVADAPVERREVAGTLADPRWLAAVDGGRWWAAEPGVGRVADGVPARVDRLRALGNAVVPQIAEWIGRRILAVSQEVA